MFVEGVKAINDGWELTKDVKIPADKWLVAH
jgi:hypothetical protein